MSFSKPVFYPIIPFDRNSIQGSYYYAEFEVIGDSQTVGYEYDLDEVGTTNRWGGTTGYKTHNVAIYKNYLTNGRSYNLRVRVQDSAGNYSEWSDTLLFKCYSNPTITFNVTEGQTINNSSYVFELNYNQAQSQKLNYAKFYIYDNNDKLIHESEKIFNTSNPPLTIQYVFNGFENNQSYKIKALVETIYEREIVTELIGFNVVYQNPVIYSRLKLNNKCNDGYINAHSDLFIGEGESNPVLMPFIEDGDKYSAYAVLPDPRIEYDSNTSGWIDWNKGVDITKNFLMKYWFTVGTINNNIVKLSNDNGYYLNIKYVRNLQGDYVEITTSDGAIVNSNIIDHCNSTSIVYLWLKVVDNNWEVILSEEDRDTTIFNWNDDDNNVAWNMTSDLTLFEEDYENVLENTEVYKEINADGFDEVLIGNAICRKLLFSLDTAQSYNNEFDEWSEFILLRCDFDRNLKAGNLRETLGNLSHIRIKRKNDDNNTWIQVYEKKINTEEDLVIDFNDYGIPSGINEKYALVPVVGGIEGNYITAEVTPKWNYVFVSDGEQCFKLYSGVNYGTTTKNKPIGIMNPIGNTYPIVIENGVTNYYSGMLSGKLYGYNYETTRILDRNDVVKQANDFVNFLENGKAKFITDWNGNCFLVKMIDSPTIVYDMSATNGTVSVAFSWVEQGKYDNEEDLYDNGYI